MSSRKGRKRTAGPLDAVHKPPHKVANLADLLQGPAVVRSRSSQGHATASLSKLQTTTTGKASACAAVDPAGCTASNKKPKRTVEYCSPRAPSEEPSNTSVLWCEDLETDYMEPLTVQRNRQRKQTQPARVQRIGKDNDKFFDAFLKDVSKACVHWDPVKFGLKRETRVSSRFKNTAFSKQAARINHREQARRFNPIGEEELPAAPRSRPVVEEVIVDATFAIRHTRDTLQELGRKWAVEVAPTKRKAGSRQRTVQCSYCGQLDQYMKPFNSCLECWEDRLKRARLSTCSAPALEAAEELPYNGSLAVKTGATGRHTSTAGGNAMNAQNARVTNQHREERGGQGGEKASAILEHDAAGLFSPLLNQIYAVLHKCNLQGCADEGSIVQLSQLLGNLCHNKFTAQQLLGGHADAALAADAGVVRLANGAAPSVPGEGINGHATDTGSDRDTVETRATGRDVSGDRISSEAAAPAGPANRLPTGADLIDLVSSDAASDERPSEEVSSESTESGRSGSDEEETENCAGVNDAKQDMRLGGKRVRQNGGTRSQPQAGTSKHMDARPNLSCDVANSADATSERLTSTGGDDQAVRTRDGHAVSTPSSPRLAGTAVKTAWLATAVGPQASRAKRVDSAKLLPNRTTTAQPRRAQQQVGKAKPQGKVAPSSEAAYKRDKTIAEGNAAAPAPSIGPSGKAKAANGNGLKSPKRRPASDNEHQAEGCHPPSYSLQGAAAKEGLGLPPVASGSHRSLVARLRESFGAAVTTFTGRKPTRDVPTSRVENSRDPVPASTAPKQQLPKNIPKGAVTKSVMKSTVAKDGGASKPKGTTGPSTAEARDSNGDVALQTEAAGAGASGRKGQALPGKGVTKVRAPLSVPRMRGHKSFLLNGGVMGNHYSTRSQGTLRGPTQIRRTKKPDAKTGKK